MRALVFMVISFRCGRQVLGNKFFRYMAKLENYYSLSKLASPIVIGSKLLRYLTVVVGKVQPACTQYLGKAEGSAVGVDNDNQESDCLWRTYTACMRCHNATEHLVMNMQLDLNLRTSPQRVQPQHQLVRLRDLPAAPLPPYRSPLPLPLILRNSLKLPHREINLWTVRHTGGTDALPPQTLQTACRVPA